MNILITGANGFIGKYLKEYFQERNNKVFTISRKLNSSNNAANDYVADLSDINFIKNNFTENIFGEKIDAIVHCAAILSTTDNKDIAVFHMNNAITESMIHIAKTTKTTKFINISSIGVYPNISGVYNEESMVEPSVNHECLYSLSKICSEELFKFYLNDTIHVINLRLGQVYGKGMRDDRIYSIMKDELDNVNTITVFGNGERISNFVSIDYCINKIDKIVNNDMIKGTFNLGEKNLSYFDLAKMIISEFGNTSSKIVLIEKGVKSKVIIDSTKINSL
ncbi:NAD(P)-dependent oxidoreductase [Elizabethkingia meningoseptica]|uniref:NAD-dependent epimerase/dehydratase family protein n=1 Tax=Elizabethkingia meningoseptica TaxID=238 RepID=UPI002DD61F1B|nr:NAD(P)-dependent oxidoreductase [Elizabethkingia meningoseptica]MEC4712259.1 NAD(P)-dependent oxidoreductase [Elizabethkingia meningoseptica]